MAVVLHERAQDILEYIIMYKRQHDGNSPTTREISDQIDASVSSVHGHLQRLQEHGKIRLAGERARSIEVVGGEWRVTECQ